MTIRDKKDTFLLIWMVKGHIPSHWNDEVLEVVKDDYTKRLWANEECYLATDGFEEAYNAYLAGAT